MPLHVKSYEDGSVETEYEQDPGELQLFDNWMLRMARLIVHRGGHMLQTVIAIEEMAELQQELCKCLRGKGQMEDLTEELADVLIVAAEIMAMYPVDMQQLKLAVAYKIQRTLDRMDLGEE